NPSTFFSALRSSYGIWRSLMITTLFKQHSPLGSHPTLDGQHSQHKRRRRRKTASRGRSRQGIYPRLRKAHGHHPRQPQALLQALPPCCKGHPGSVPLYGYRRAIPSGQKAWTALRTRDPCPKRLGCPHPMFHTSLAASSVTLERVLNASRSRLTRMMSIVEYAIRSRASSSAISKSRSRDIPSNACLSPRSYWSFPTPRIRSCTAAETAFLTSAANSSLVTAPPGGRTKT